MVEFPVEGIYRIKSVKLGCYAGILEDQNVLRGESKTQHGMLFKTFMSPPSAHCGQWKLQYLEYEDDTERVCLLSEADIKCCNYLGVGAVNKVSCLL
jgi:hypothetical protein